MKRILITGKNSFVGVSFDKFVKCNYPNLYSIDTLDMESAHWKEFDFSNYDVVFHVAGIAHSDTGKLSADKSHAYYSVNTKLAIETANIAKTSGVKQFIFMSSAIVYGDSTPIGKKIKITLDTPVSPSNFYSDSKLQAEIGINELADKNFKVVILRPPMVYGKGCKGNYITMSKIAKTFPLFPYIDNCRSMLYIDNLCEFVHLMIKNNESGTFFPQNNDYINTSEMIKCIASVNEKKVYLVKGFSGILRFCGHFFKFITKAFGNLYYDMEMSEYKEPYRVVSTLEKSIIMTEDSN